MLSTCVFEMRELGYIEIGLTQVLGVPVRRINEIVFWKTRHHWYGTVR